MFEDHPIFGVGVENYIPYRKAHVDGSDYAAHNLIGELLGEAGLLGAVPFALLVFAILMNSQKTPCRVRSRATGAMGNGAIGLVVAATWSFCSSFSASADITWTGSIGCGQQHSAPWRFSSAGQLSTTSSRIKRMR